MLKHTHITVVLWRSSLVHHGSVYIQHHGIRKEQSRTMSGNDVCWDCTEKPLTKNRTSPKQCPQADCLQLNVISGWFLPSWEHVHTCVCFHVHFWDSVWGRNSESELLQQLSDTDLLAVFLFILTCSPDFYSYLRETLLFQCVLLLKKVQSREYREYILITAHGSSGSGSITVTQHQMLAQSSAVFYYYHLPGVEVTDYLTSGRTRGRGSDLEKLQM